MSAAAALRRPSCLLVPSCFSARGRIRRCAARVAASSELAGAIIGCLQVSFAWSGFNNAMISNVGMVLRNIYSKKFLGQLKV